MRNRLQELRWQKNWSVTKLSMRSGVSVSTISEIENDQQMKPRVLTALRLAHALGVSVEDIFKA